jgi:pimeloyl-ACP methyl ester carboxylesterase
MTSLVKTIHLPNGVKLQYVEQGDPAGIPVLLLHGYTDSWRSFEPVLPYLPASIHAFALTQRGHGDAGRPVTGYRFEDFAADVAAFMSAIQTGPAVIAGSSMGSFVARRFAVDYSERTLGLALMSTFLTYRGNPGVQALWDAVSQFTDPIDPGFVREFQQSCLAQPVSAEFFDTIVQESLKVPASVWRAVLEAQMDVDFSNELSKINAPALIVWGDRDTFAPRADQDALRAAICDSRLVVYPGAGHALHWEQPERFAADLVAFCDDLVARGTRITQRAAAV